MEGVTLPFKNQRCLFCVQKVSKGYQNIAEGSDRQETFLKGISVLSQFFSVPSILKFSEQSSWSAAGPEDFFGDVSCNGCYTLLDNLVTLHQVIISTQVSLQEKADEIKATIVQSEAIVKVNEWQYCVKTCSQFRKEILESIEAKRPPKYNAVFKRKTTGPLSKTRPSASRFRSARIKDDKVDRTASVTNLTPAYVKLERIDRLIPQKEAKSDECSPANWNHSLSLRKASGNDDDDGNEPDISIKTENDTSGNLPGFRKHEQNAARLKTPQTVRKRGRPSKTLEAHEIRPKQSVLQLKEKHNNQERSQTNDSLQDPPTKRGQRNKPVFIVDASLGLLMFFNVKLRRNSDNLQCLHPSCTFSEPIVGFGAEQVAFRNFRFHVRQFHRAPYVSTLEANAENEYWCHICDFQYPSCEILSEHKRKIHPDAPQLLTLCEVCGDSVRPAIAMNHTFTHKNFDERQLAVASKQRRRGRHKDVSKPACFPCDECSKVFKCHTELRIHKESHIPLEIRRKWTCDICGIKLASRNILQNHKRQVHLKAIPKSLKCPYCGRDYLSYQRSKFNDHLRSHTGDKPFQCSTCGNAFHSKDNLHKHEKLHGDASVTCEFCSSAFKSLAHLRVHQRKYHRNLSEPSDNVIKRMPKKPFIGPQLLYPCEPCGHQYRFKSMLVSHLKGKHNMKQIGNEDFPSMWTYQDQYGDDK